MSSKDQDEVITARGNMNIRKLENRKQIIWQSNISLPIRQKMEFNEIKLVADLNGNKNHIETHICRFL